MAKALKSHDRQLLSLWFSDIFLGGEGAEEPKQQEGKVKGRITYSVGASGI